MFLAKVAKAKKNAKELVTQHFFRSCENPVILRKGGLFQWRGEWNRDVQCSNTLYRCVEILESKLGNLCRYLGSETHELAVLIEHDDFPCLLHGINNSFGVKRNNSSDVDNFNA